MDPAAGVGRARAAGDEGNPRAAGQLAVGVGHVGDPALLSAHDGVDLRRVVERVEHHQEAFARHREDAVAALDYELVNEDLAAAAYGHGGALAGTDDGVIRHALGINPCHGKGQQEQAHDGRCGGHMHESDQGYFGRRAREERLAAQKRAASARQARASRTRRPLRRNVRSDAPGDRHGADASSQIRVRRGSLPARLSSARGVGSDNLIHDCMIATIKCYGGAIADRITLLGVGD